MSRLTIGLDLGKRSDFTATCVLQTEDPPGRDFEDEGRPEVRLDFDSCGRRLAPPPSPGPGAWPSPGARRHGVIHLERHPLGTSYPAIVEAVAALVARPEIRALDARPALIVDETGVGAAVADMFADRRMPGIAFHSMMITSGLGWRRERRPGGQRLFVGKSLLASTLQATLGGGRLSVVPGLPLAGVLKAEMLDFEVKVTAAANETYSHREGKHDDILLAVAMATWQAERPVRGYRLVGLA